MSLKDGRTFQVVTKMKVLGEMLDEQGRAQTSADHRGSEALALWWRNRHVLRSPSLPILERFRRLAATLGACVLHGCGGWLPCKGLCSWLTARELHFQRQMLDLAREEDEPWGAWL